MPSIQDDEIDLLVVGFGLAGAACAIFAHDAGMRVLIVEKMPRPGGISITAGGGVLYATDADGAFACLQAACGGRTPDGVLRSFVDGLCRIPTWLSSMTERSALALELRTSQVEQIPYDLPGRDSLGTLLVKPLDNFSPFPWASGLRGGARLFQILWHNVMSRSIPVRYGTAAQRLDVGSDRRVVGAWVRSADQEMHVSASAGVVLACGGFEWDEDLKRQYFQGMPILPVAGPGNTGDGLRMAQAAGASLWHMWHYHGGYGFKVPGLDYAIRHTFYGSRYSKGRDPEFHVVPWIAVDKDGRRFMNELHPYPNDTNARPLEIFDPDRLEYPRIPCYLVFDDAGIRRGPIGHPIATVESRSSYTWSLDNQAEVESGLIVRGDSLGELVARLNHEVGAHITEAVLDDTIERWNNACEVGTDAQFLRPSPTMMPIKGPPYYALPAWPIVSNTQGGPAHNADRQVLDAFGAPIPGLYSAGELGSLFGHLYLISGNISECLVSGWLVARHLRQAAVSAAA